jgi:hypothetical protein
MWIRITPIDLQLLTTHLPSGRLQYKMVFHCWALGCRYKALDGLVCSEIKRIILDFKKRCLVATPLAIGTGIRLRSIPYVR